MSLLWRTAIRRTAVWEPLDSVEHIHPSELENDYHAPIKQHHVQRLMKSIKENGYSPERHGQLGLNITDHGENIYHHADGAETDPEDPHHHEHLLQALKSLNHGEVPVHIHDQSSDPEGDPAPKYYHGTNVADLERVHPNHGSRGNFGNNLGIHEPGYAYATSRSTAEHYADQVALTHGGRPHVYEVSPRGPVEKDPAYDAHGNSRGNWADDMRSKHGFDVVGEEDLGHSEPEDWEDEDDWNERQDW
jgi:hypothetical protein